VQISGQELDVTEGSARYVQVGLPVYSERYGRMIDFDTDGEEWARNLPTAYRNGVMSVSAEEIIEPADTQLSVQRTRARPGACRQARAASALRPCPVPVAQPSTPRSSASASAPLAKPWG
jgi:hypothetical protein